MSVLVSNSGMGACLWILSAAPIMKREWNALETGSNFALIFKSDPDLTAFSTADLSPEITVCIGLFIFATTA